jgi:hypothetical protein
MASPGCDCAVLPVRNRREIFSSGNAEASQCVMSPKGGQGWRKGGDDHLLKRGFLQIKKTKDNILLDKPLIVYFPQISPKSSPHPGT